MTTKRPHLSFPQLFNMSFGFMGIQFGWGLQLANMSAIYANLGAKPDDIPILWLAAPVTGLLVQPIVGALSDRTWGPLGRRRPYFLVGAILASIGLFFMPTSRTIWMAAGLLWMLDASINISMEPFRAFVADKLDVSQRTAGFVMQSFFIGIGQTLANALPYLLGEMGVSGSTASGIPLTVKYSFQAGAVVFLVCVLWTVFTTTEFPPEDPAAFDRAKRGRGGIGALFSEIGSSIRDMPATMRQLAVVQFFTWLGLFCMWMFSGLAVARNVFGATEQSGPVFERGTAWNSLGFAVYSVVCFAVAFVLPKLAKATSRKTTHAVALVCGAIGLLSFFVIQDRYMVLAAMVGVGIAWASILSMPYAILSGSIPAARMGVYMGVFNFFIVIPEILASLGFKHLIRLLFGADNPNTPQYMVVLGGISLLIAAVLVMRVRDDGDAAPENAVIAGDEHEPLTTQQSAQPVPSDALINPDPRDRS